jgi:AAA ATPase domain
VGVEGSGVDALVGSFELLERSGQLGVLTDSLRAVSSGGQGRLLLLRGEAGVGKTAVVRRFCAAQRSPGRILWGACEALFTPRALGPFVDDAQAVGGELEELVERGGRPHQCWCWKICTGPTRRRSMSSGCLAAGSIGFAPWFSRLIVMTSSTRFTPCVS